MLQNLHQVPHHFFANPSDERRTLGRDANQDFAPIVRGDRTHQVPKIFKARHQAARRRRGMPHFLGDRRHGKNFFLVQKREKKKLHEGDIPRCELLTETQQKTTLHLQNNVRQALCVRTNLIGWSSCKLGQASRIQGD